MPLHGVVHGQDEVRHVLLGALLSRLLEHAGAVGKGKGGVVEGAGGREPAQNAVEQGGGWLRGRIGSEARKEPQGEGRGKEGAEREHGVINA